MKREIHMSRMEDMLSMQLEFINKINDLIIYDKEHSENPEKTKWLEGFCQTQEKALDMAVTLFNKHKEGILAKEKEELKAKEEAKKSQAAKEKAQRKQEEEQQAIKADLEKAKTEEGSLFEGLE